TRRALEPHHVLINTGLRNEVLAEEIVVGEAAPQIVVVPRASALDPGLALGADPNTLCLQLRDGTVSAGWASEAILRCKLVQVKPAWEITVQKRKCAALTRV